MTMVQGAFWLGVVLATLARAEITVIHEESFSFQKTWTEDVSDKENLVMKDETVANKGDGTVLTCIKEEGLQLNRTAMADVTYFKNGYSLNECVNFCLRNHPDKSHVLISYYDRTLFSDKFKCLCADAEALARAKALSETACRIMCPNSPPKYRCGDASDNILSVHCLQRSCSSAYVVSAEPICYTRLPHDSHGCVSSSQVVWSHAHNVRNFSAAVNDQQACVWECHDHHESAMYSLSRVVGGDGSGDGVNDGVLTCSCGYAKAFEPGAVVDAKFCDMLMPTAGKEDGGGSAYYNVKCLTDLDEHTVEELNPEKQCQSIYPLGCIYEELVNSSRTPVIQITHLDLPDPQSCHFACSSVFGSSSHHVGIRWDRTLAVMTCVCLRQEDWNSTMISPPSACDIECQPKGSGLMCGGPDKQQPASDYPAVSLYCLHHGLTESSESYEILDSSSSSSSALQQDENLLLLNEIRGALSSQSIEADVIVALVTLMCLLLLTIVIYLCFSRGISSLSRQVM